MTDLAQFTAWRDALMAARYQGIRTVEYDGNRCGTGRILQMRCRLASIRARLSATKPIATLSSAGGALIRMGDTLLVLRIPAEVSAQMTPGSVLLDVMRQWVRVQHGDHDACRLASDGDGDCPNSATQREHSQKLASFLPLVGFLLTSNMLLRNCSINSITQLFASLGETKDASGGDDQVFPRHLPTFCNYTPRGSSDLEGRK